ncbi:lysophospholipid acyltransferase family protein [Castellaniella sp.]|uniref:lysophospholipid acyltransferase family protein n=1 Tax=Castellaniella sp. TaxID=1955812 RepID=UPI00356914F9
MAVLFFAVRSVLVSTWIGLGLLTELLCFPWLGRRARRWCVRGWSRVLMALCGVRLRVLGAPQPRGAVLWVSNHVSWVDVFVLNSVRPTSFVAKSDIRGWPVIGPLAAWSGTLFIDRQHRRAVRDASRQMQDCFGYGGVVGLFPEGTSTDGRDVLNFHTGLFDAAIQAVVPVQPVALRFYRAGRRAPELAFIGEQTLVANLWVLLGSRKVEVHCEFLPPMSAGPALSRSDLARRAREAIRDKVVVPH